MQASSTYERLAGDLHRHGASRMPIPTGGPHEHGHGHSHGLIDPSIKRSRAGLRAVGVSLGVLGATAAVQVAIYAAPGSVDPARRPDPQLQADEDGEHDRQAGGAPLAERNRNAVPRGSAASAS